MQPAVGGKIELGRCSCIVIISVGHGLGLLDITQMANAAAASLALYETTASFENQIK